MAPALLAEDNPRFGHGTPSGSDFLSTRGLLYSWFADNMRPFSCLSPANLHDNEKLALFGMPSVAQFTTQQIAVDLWLKQSLVSDLYTT